MLPIIYSIPVFVIGVFFLWKSSDFLVDGTCKTAAQIGVSTLIISVILVGFGTSAPEFAISVGSAVQKNADISLGNIIGSCVANLLLVLGISTIIRPITVRKGIIKREAPIMLLATLILLVSAYFSLLDKYHILGGIFFLVFFVIFVLYFIGCARRERVSCEKIDPGKTGKNIFFIIIGIAGVVFGAYLLIESAVSIANFFSVPTFFIAITIVAVGTSLPELVVSAMAAYKEKDDIAVGNVLGSNVFNILLILGVSAIFIPLGAVLSVNLIIILLAVSLIMFPILYTGHRISRLEGVFMLIMYSVFIWYSYVV